MQFDITEVLASASHMDSAAPPEALGQEDLKRLKDALGAKSAKQLNNKWWCWGQINGKVPIAFRCAANWTPQMELNLEIDWTGNVSNLNDIARTLGIPITQVYAWYIDVAQRAHRIERQHQERLQRSQKPSRPSADQLNLL